MTILKRSFFGQWNSLLASLLLISPLMGSYQDTVEKSFPTEGVGLLKLDFEKSPLNIDTYDGSDVKISITRSLKHGDKKDFEKELDRLELNFNQSGNDISGELKYKHSSNSILGLFGGGRKSLQFKTTVRLPRHFNLDAGTSGGAIHLKNLTGKVSLRTSGGGISVNKVTGDTIARTSGGGITVGDSHGAMNLRTSGGRIKANGLKGHLNARTSGGGIHVGDHSGNADVSTSGGSIELGSVKGNITACTSGGGIQAVMVGQPDKDCSLRTSGGSIHLKVSPDANLRIDASTSGGGVKSNLTLSNPELKRSSLQGRAQLGWSPSQGPHFRREHPNKFNLGEIGISQECGEEFTLSPPSSTRLHGSCEIGAKAEWPSLCQPHRSPRTPERHVQPKGNVSHHPRYPGAVGQIWL